MKEKSFAKELAELINRHGIDAMFETNDFILADVAVDALNAYGKAYRKRTELKDWRDTPVDDCNCPTCVLRRKLEGKKTARPEPGGVRYKKPQAFDVPKEVAGIAELIAELFPGAKIELHRIDVPRNNPRNRRRNKNKRNGKGGNK